MYRNKFLLFAFISIVLFGCKTNVELPLFTRADPNQIGIMFQNAIHETEEFNILDYLYFYNGAGVAAGDINNDGLCDLYFVSNQGKNALYLNKGQVNGIPKFEDIGDAAGVQGISDWKTGVTMADINADGLLDIYVSAIGDYKGLEGTNELYINNGDLTFTERAHEYGLDFKGFATQAAFFDYDKDGDLDCYLLNHAVHNTRSYDRVNTRMLKDNEAGDYLYKNENGIFKDVSKESGIYQAAMGYGLGISVADLNDDGWLDIYVGNDFHEDDYYYVNQQNGTFKEEVKEHFRHLSRFSMGSDAADINNDGYLDIMTLDMYPEDETVEKSSAGEDPLDIYLYKLRFGYFNQYSRNCLQLNLGGEKFSDIAAMAGVAATDWSWSTLMADYDLDGQKDIFITNGILRRPNDLDYLKFVVSDSLHYNVPTSAQLNQEAINKMPEGRWHNYLFKGGANLKFEDKSETWGFGEKTLSNGSVYADLDNDGDWDLVTNNLNEPAGIYLNNAQDRGRNYLKIKLNGEGKNAYGVGAKVFVWTGTLKQTLQLMPTRGFESAVEPSLIFGFGEHQKIDSLQIIWEDNRSQLIYNLPVNQQLVLNQKNAKKNKVSPQGTSNDKFFSEASEGLNIQFQHLENTYFDFSRELLIPFKVSIDGPKMAIGDVNADGLDDLFICGAKYQAGVLQIQTKEGFQQSNREVFLADSLSEDVDAQFLDVDNDKDLDLYVVSGGNEFYGNMPQLLDRVYLNDGKGNFTKSSGLLPQMLENKSCVRPTDFDGDGDMDLFVGGRVLAFQYGTSPRSFLLENKGRGRFVDVTQKIAPQLQYAGMITDAIWTDLNNDKLPDLTIVGDWMPIKTFINKKGKFEERTNNGLATKSGFWNGVVAEDFDADGDVDLMVGNLGTNTKFQKGKGGVLRMYINDFDESGTHEHLLTYNRGEKWYPVNTMAELAKQMPGLINKKFTTHKSFAGKSIDDIIDKRKLKKASVLEVNCFESVYLENDGTGKFKASALPIMAQLSKVMSLALHDVDHDGRMDVLLGGNFDGASTYQSRYDASYGLILLNKGKGSFKELLPTESGMRLEGDVRDLKYIKMSRGSYWMVARNNNRVQVFKIKK